MMESEPQVLFVDHFSLVNSSSEELRVRDLAGPI
jgi:hypothetical protein